jgi:hypothetical protein
VRCGSNTNTFAFLDGITIGCCLGLTLLIDGDPWMCTGGVE